MLTEKANILCLYEILKKYSDVDHVLTMKDILGKMNSLYDVNVDRRTIYRNIDALIEFGYDISTFKDNDKGYYLRERDFEPSELHMLGDAILTADFIPEKEGKELIAKLQSLGSVHQAKLLGHLAYVKTNKKSPNKEIFLTVEILDEAIRAKKQVIFDYTAYDLTMVQKPRRETKYLVNPYVLYWGGNQYYLISNLVPHDGFCHFRLDRIKNISITDAPVKELPPGFDPYEYAKNSLFMFGGDTERFLIECDRSILNDVVDQFGDKLTILSHTEDTFTTVVKATTGGMRLWAIHYFETCKVLEPKWLVDDVSNALRRGIEKWDIKIE